MPAGTLGKNGKLWLREGGQDTMNAWTELSNCQDVTINLEKGEADASTRASGGWRQTLGTLKDGTIEFTMVYAPSDTGFGLLQDAYFQDLLLGVQYLDGEPGNGIQGDFVVTNFSEPQPLEGVMTVEVTLKPAPSDTPPALVTAVSHS